MDAPSSALVDAAEPETHSYDYDLVVIGGGSGGISCAKEAARLGKKVALLDFVKPSPQGTKWGLGGTCVNVGCIPKKLFHTAALNGERLTEARHYGWELAEQLPNHQWTSLVERVGDHIGSLNWGYRTELRSKGVEYLNALGRFVDAHTIETKNRAGEIKNITARRIVVAVGGRPSYPDIPGAREFGLTSDDMFSLAEPPGETLVVGASYVALECAGFLRGLGFPTTVMVRSILLRGFDQEIAEKIGAYMADHGTKFVRPAVPTRIEKLDSGRKRVTYAVFAADGSKTEATMDVDTVLFAVGRYADTKLLGCEAAGLVTDAATGKFAAHNERTNVPHIYALGDVLLGRPELTPVAILAGKLLARRLYAASTVTMDYDKVPTTVFTPLEYGACGLSEEDAIARKGADNIEVYHSYFKPLEWTVGEGPDNTCFAKLVCDKTDNLRVLGLHILSPNAGEVTQGWAAAMKLGATKETFEMTVGIHPTIAEEFTTIRITKASGEDPKKTGC